MEPHVSPFPLPDLAASLAALPGVGPATAAQLADRGLATWGDALLWLPSRYEDRRQPTPLDQLEPGSRCVVQGVVESNGRWGQKGKVWRVVLTQDGRRLICLWFRFGRDFLADLLPGTEVFVVGTVDRDRQGDWQMAHPELIPADQAQGHPGLGRVVPIYPEVKGVAPGRVRRFMAELVGRVTERLPDPLFGLLPGDMYPLPLGEALRAAHLPGDQTGPADLDPALAPWRLSLATQELLYFELGLALKRRQRQRVTGRPLAPAGRLVSRFLRALPFKLTADQLRAVEEIRTDLEKPHPMGRLLAGDVGTGKTVVAACAALLAAEAGAQTAFMAPTEVLARQHLTGLARHLEPLGLRLALAVGSQGAADKTQARQAAAGDAQVVLGTHALLSQGLDFDRLGLVIIDEQHRFGVEQRLALAAKGDNPHLLVLSATPIPRTMALALAGHLDLSDLRERPGGAPRTQTVVLEHGQRQAAVAHLKQTLAAGQQAYVICPLVEASDKIEARDAVQTWRNLSAYFPQTQVGLLTGRMDGPEQADTLERFKSGELGILVATTVVEVGVDVPNATLIIVLGAERFGLSQLHQLRGRVGRGGTQGHCYLVAGPQAGAAARERLEVLARTNDGLAIAEDDLRLRGPGEALGRHQAGLPSFAVADWQADAGLIPPLRALVESWLARDPDLAGPELAPVRDEALRRWGRRLGLAQAG